MQCKRTWTGTHPSRCFMTCKLLAHEPVCGFAAYGSNATVAKTEEELEDRHQSLFGDADGADDIKITMPSKDTANGEDANGAHLNGEAVSNGQNLTQERNSTHEPSPLNVLHQTRLLELTTHNTNTHYIVMIVRVHELRVYQPPHNATHCHDCQRGQEAQAQHDLPCFEYLSGSRH